MEEKPEYIEMVGTGNTTPVNGATNSLGIIEKDHALGDSSHLETGLIDGITAEHRDYLISRHGTADLNPLPTMDPADPLNWPAWKKNTNLFLVAFHAMMTTFTAAAVIPAFETFSIDFGISITKASYLTSIQILILGFAPLFWKPVSNRFGRRPIWLISTLCSMVCNIGCAESHSYASQVVTRLLVAFFISPAIAISSAVVTETFFARERGAKMGIWTLMVTLGPPSGPFVMGFVAYHTGGYEWIYWTLAITNGVQFILYFFLSPETLYIRNAPTPPPSSSAFKRQYLNFGRLDPHPLSFADFWTPIKMFAYPNILLPTIAYSIVFNFSSVLLTVEIPQLFTPKYHFNAQQIGLQFIGMVVGSVLGEQFGGRGSDFWMRRAGKKVGRSGVVRAERRIWVSYPGFMTVIIGLVVFCVQVEHLSHYNVTPIVGIAISAFGNQIITTVLVTYAVDCHHEHAASIGVFINLVRSTWGFIGPFWFPDMFTSLGLSGSAGLMVGIIVVFSTLPTIFIQWKGRQIRDRRSKNELDQVRAITR
ncbi:related to synaptic vesicle transporter SVOP and related transporters (major facilitator superfamily) [Phialocephala subalpina]|uniref:Related to synaptic vesicle transporter SVOP and related transporters (Major facilitator superfamily) n=1 Tax=Phialocephala subalpina TaxID=576137 RepID=A0A1L7WSE1_9HELO|nr:related to synaptic vesicle transporter SVOP and related transporters (major facilitator superfamily) [Phialocephala subalpina]